MERTELFAQLMDSLFSFSQVSGRNQNMPRTYGTDDMLYMAEVHLIRDIANYDGVTITQLASINQKSKSAMSQLIDKLLQKGLVKKEKHPDGNRQVAIYLTEKGDIINKFHARLDEQEYNKLLSKLGGYSDEDFRKFIDLLNFLNIGSEKAIRSKTRRYSL